MSSTIGNTSMSQVPASRLLELQKKVEEYNNDLSQYHDFIEEYTQLIESGLEETNIENSDVLDMYHNLMVKKDEFIVDIYDNIGNPPVIAKLSEAKVNLDNRFSVDIARLIQDNMHPSYRTSKMELINSENINHPTKSINAAFKLLGDYGLSEEIKNIPISKYDELEISKKELENHQIIKIGRFETNTRLIEFTISYNQYNLTHFDKSEFDHKGRVFTGDIDGMNILSRQYRGVIIITNLKENDKNLTVKAHIMCPDNDIGSIYHETIGPEISIKFLYDSNNVYISFDDFKPFRLNWYVDASGELHYFDMHDPKMGLQSTIQYEWFGYFTDMSYRHEKFEVIKKGDINLEDISEFDSIELKPLKEGFIRYKGIGYKSNELILSPHISNSHRWTSHNVSGTSYDNRLNVTRSFPYYLYREMKKYNYRKIKYRVFNVYNINNDIYYCTNLGLYQYNRIANVCEQVYEFPSFVMGNANDKIFVIYFDPDTNNTRIVYSKMSNMIDFTNEGHIISNYNYFNDDKQNDFINTRSYYIEEIQSLLNYHNGFFYFTKYDLSDRITLNISAVYDEKTFKYISKDNLLFLKFTNGIVVLDITSNTYFEINVPDFNSANDLIIDMIDLDIGKNDLGVIIKKSSGEVFIYYYDLLDRSFSTNSKRLEFYENLINPRMCSFRNGASVVIYEDSGNYRYFNIEHKVLKFDYSESFEIESISLETDIDLEAEALYIPNGYHDNIIYHLNQDSDVQSITINGYNITISPTLIEKNVSIKDIKRDIRNTLSSIYQDRQEPVDYKLNIFLSHKDEVDNLHDNLEFTSMITEIGQYNEQETPKDEWKFRGEHALRHILINKSGDIYFSGYHIGALPLYYTDGSPKFTNEFFEKLQLPAGKKVKDITLQYSKVSESQISRVNYLFTDGYYGYSGAHLMYKAPYLSSSFKQESVLSQKNLYDNSTYGKIIIPEKLPDGETLNNGQVDNIFCMENSGGTLGYQLKDGRTFIPTKYKGFIKKFFTGNRGSNGAYNFSIILSNDGQLFITGKLYEIDDSIENWNHSQGKFERLLSPLGRFVLDFWAGNNGEIIAKIDNGEYYCIGYNNYGGLGLNHTEPVTKWEKLRIPTSYHYNNIKQFAFNDFGTMILMTDGSMWASSYTNSTRELLMSNLPIIESKEYGFRKCLLDDIDRIIQPSKNSNYNQSTIMCVDRKGNVITFGEYHIDEEGKFQKSIKFNNAVTPWSYTKLPGNHLSDKINYFTSGHYDVDYMISYLVINNRIYTIGNFDETPYPYGSAYGLGYKSGPVNQWTSVAIDVKVDQVFRTNMTTIILDTNNNLWYTGIIDRHRLPSETQSGEILKPTRITDLTQIQQIKDILKDNVKEFHGRPGLQIIELKDGRYAYWGDPGEWMGYGNNDSNITTNQIVLHNEINNLLSAFYTYHEEPLLKNKTITSWTTDNEGDKNHIITCEDGSVFVQDETGDLSFNNTSLYLREHPALYDIKKIMISLVQDPSFTTRKTTKMYFVLTKDNELKFMKFHPLTKQPSGYLSDYVIENVKDIYCQRAHGILIEYLDRNIDSLYFQYNPLFRTGVEEIQFPYNELIRIVDENTSEELRPTKIYDNKFGTTKNFMFTRSDNQFYTNHVGSEIFQVADGTELTKSKVRQRTKTGIITEDVYSNELAPENVLTLCRVTNPALPQGRPSRLEVFEKDSYVWFGNRLFYSGLNRYGLGLLGESYISFDDVEDIPITIPNPDFNPTQPLTNENSELIDSTFTGTIPTFSKQIMFKELDLSSILVEPSQIKKFVRIKKNLFFIANNKLYGAGDNTYGQLGQGHNDPIDYQENSLGIVLVKDNVKDLLCTTGDTVFIRDMENKIWSVGRNEYGQLGLGHYEKNVFEFQEVNLEEPDEISTIISNGRSTFAIRLFDTVMAIGKNDEGQLGIGSTLLASEWTRCRNLEKIDQIILSESNGFAFAISETGVLYHTGNFKSYNELGLSDSNNRNVEFNKTGLTDIEYATSYKDTMYAINSKGELFVKGCAYGYIYDQGVGIPFNRVGYSPEIGEGVSYIENLTYCLMDSPTLLTNIVIKNWTKVPGDINRRIASLCPSEMKLLALKQDGSILYSGIVPADKNLDRKYINKTEMERGHIESFEYLTGIRTAKQLINGGEVTFMYIDTNNDLWGSFSFLYSNDDDKWFLPIGALYNTSYSAVEYGSDSVDNDKLVMRDLVVKMYRGFVDESNVFESIGKQYIYNTDINKRLLINELFLNKSCREVYELLEGIEDYPDCKKYSIELTVQPSKVEHINLNVDVSLYEDSDIWVIGSLN